MNQEVIVFVRPSDMISPRLFKLTSICENIFDRVVFLGAKRSTQKVVQDVGTVEFKKIGIYYPYSSLKYIIGTIIFVLSAFIRLVKIRPKVVHSSDLEGAIPGAIYKFFFRNSYLIVNVHDNYFARYKVSDHVKAFLKFVEYKFYKRADMLLFPDSNRVEIFKPYNFENTWCIPNTPDDPGYVTPTEAKDKIKLFVAGFISTVRGLDQFIKLADTYQRVEVHYVGRCSDEDMKKINNCKGAVYHGRMSQSETLEIGKSCHVLPIYYEPNKEIHVYASPNKLFDAFALGRPVVMNDGINVTAFVRDYDMGEIVDYYNVDDLYKALCRIVDNHDSYAARCNSIRSYYLEEFRWVKYQEQLIDFFKKIKVS